MTRRLGERSDFLRTVLDAFPSPVFVVDDDLRILELNLSAAKMLGKEGERVIRMRGGEILQCLYSYETPEGCGKSAHCKQCVIRSSVNGSREGLRVIRKKTRMDLVKGDEIQELHILVTTAPFEFDDEGYTLLVLEDIGELMELKNILPMCAKCKKVRDDEEYWHNVDIYFKKHLDVDFSHGLCPACLEELHPGLRET